ncbi:MAG: hypothetical protein Kow0075_16640 [Salibacteraceae bacterium]
MIVKQDIEIRDRESLMLAKNQLRKELSDQRLLLEHNLSVVREKWTLTKLTSWWIKQWMPGLIGSSASYLVSLALPSRKGLNKLEKRGHWLAIVRSFMKTFIP